MADGEHDGVHDRQRHERQRADVDIGRSSAGAGNIVTRRSNHHTAVANAGTEAAHRARPGVRIRTVPTYSHLRRADRASTRQEATVTDRSTRPLLGPLLALVVAGLVVAACASRTTTSAGTTLVPTEVVATASSP